MTLAGAPFQRTVWAALRKIPYGETTSYGQLAEQSGGLDRKRQLLHYERQTSEKLPVSPGV